MKLMLYRTYDSGGTNGDLYLNEVFQCHTIELPWLNNQHQHSCIPEGTYRLLHRWTPRFGKHFMVADVPGRSAILVHPANNAITELRGCIAPVLHLLGAGRGAYSRLALAHLVQVLEVSKDEDISLTILNNDSLTQKTKTNDADQTCTGNNATLL